MIQILIRTGYEQIFKRILKRDSNRVSNKSSNNDSNEGSKTFKHVECTIFPTFSLKSTRNIAKKTHLLQSILFPSNASRKLIYRINRSTFGDSVLWFSSFYEWVGANCSYPKCKHIACIRDTVLVYLACIFCSFKIRLSYPGLTIVSPIYI